MSPGFKIIFAVLAAIILLILTVLFEEKYIQIINDEFSNSEIKN